MMSFSYDQLLDDHNPLDFVEELANHKSWYFKRIDHNNMLLQLAGQRSKFDINLQWNDEFCALQFRCMLDMKIDDASRDVAADFLLQTNEDLFMGHFVIDTPTCQPCFRYSMMLEHIPSAVSIEMINDAIDTAILESDRFYNTFKMLSNGSIHSHELLNAAMMETLGEA